jgi:tight adherence protein B
MNLGFFIVVALALMLLAAALLLFVRAQSQEVTQGVKQRLQVGGVDEQDVTISVRNVRNPLIRWICLLFWRTGSEVQPKSVVQTLAALALLVLIVAMLTNVLISLAVAAVILVLFYMVMSQRASRRKIKIVEQLPSFLENVIRVLAAGNTFEEALVQAARESPDPIRPLFASVGRQVRLGAPLEVVLAEAGDIYRIRDVRVIALATSINRKYGGSMRSVLKSLITAIRQRGNAAKELRALTAETRFSAYTLAFITISLFLFLFLSNRTYYNSMLESTGGTVMLGVSGGMVFFGFFVLWRMIKSIDEDDS